MGIRSTMSEILAPAGDKSSVFAAVNAGADAIYLGLKEFSARSSAENFDFESLENILRYCHAFGVKVYVAMNTLVKDCETDSFLRSAVAAWNCGADALIISDVFLGKFIKQNYPEIILHLSTQAGVCNAYGALFAKEAGFSRVILSRETALDDIKEITKIIETEVFVQGALCTCFSGQCYLSSFAGGNSGNRGKCKQPCRKLYSIDRNGFESESYKLSLSDLCIGEDIERLEDAGVYSFKIEGRMRRPEYVAAAVRYYRHILDGFAEEQDLSNLKRTFNRGNYTKGLAFGQDKSFISPAVQGHIGEFVGVVKVVGGKYICSSKQCFIAGDGFKILRDGVEAGGASFGGKASNGFYLITKSRLKNGDKVFVTTDTALNFRLLSERKTIPVNISANFLVGKSVEISLNGEVFKGDKNLRASKSQPLTRELFENCFKKVDKYPFSVNFVEFKTDGVFVPLSELNAIRRRIFEDYFLKISQSNNVKYEISHTLPTIKNENNRTTAVICTDLNGVKADIGILKPKDYNCGLSCLLENFQGEKYLFLPPYATAKDIEQFKQLSCLFDGIYCEGIYGFKLAENVNKPLFVGFGLNISNKIDVLLCNAKYFALSKELTCNEIKSLITANGFYLTCGDIKVMDLVYCPFGKKCKTCDKREQYTLTDENKRKFTLRRYRTNECRFELFNCASLAVPETDSGVIADCTLQDAAEIMKICANTEKLRLKIKNYTKGHFQSPVN